MRKRKIQASILALIAVFLPALCQAQDRSVVSGINAWGDVHGGWAHLSGKGLDYWYNTNNKMVSDPPPVPCNDALCYIINDKANKQSGWLLGGEARFALPIGSYFGFQGDAGLDRIDRFWAKTARAHLFMGLAGYGTLGPAVQYATLDKAHAWRFGMEGQAWIGPVSLYGFGGHQRGSSSRDFEVKSGAFFCGEARWYVNDNTLLGVGGGAGPSREFAQATGEIQLGGQLNPISLFARAAIGDEGYRTAIAGVRLHWGQGGTLLARHRQDMLIPYAGCGLEQFDHKDVGLYYNNSG